MYSLLHWQLKSFGELLRAIIKTLANIGDNWEHIVGQGPVALIRAENMDNEWCIFTGHR